ncbi:putative transposase [Orientia tsutsugamushi str. UT76]|nr:putative transposase [Orientia tsutsugamushi str. UT76]
MLNQNLTLVQTGKHFGISIRVAGYYMKKFGYSYKKNVYLHGSKTRNKRKYQQVISSIPKENLAYIDESGIEMSICKDRSVEQKRNSCKQQKEW